MKTNLLFRLLFSVGFCLAFSSAISQTIEGKIINEKDEPIPYATIFVKETKEGTISNSEGNFKLQLSKGVYHLTIRSLAYNQLEKEVQLQSDSVYLTIALRTQEFQIREVKVFPGKEDPAYFIIRKAITKAPFYRERIQHYDADLYIKSNFEFTNIPKLYQNKIEIEDGKKLKDYFKENVTYVIESQNTITFDYPNQYDQKVISKKSSLVGFDEPPVMGLMTMSFYEERPEQVISPLSSLALKHYKYQYEGFITIDNFDVFKIKVTPKRKSDELVEGYIYIVDKIWCIYYLDFSTSFEFFDYSIQQQFENLGNDNWLPVTHKIDGKFGMLGMRGNFYYGASVKYNSIENTSFSEKEINQLSEIKNDTTSQRKRSEKEIKLSKEINEITKKEELTNKDVRKVAKLNRQVKKQQYKDSTLVESGNYNNYKIDDKKDSLNTEISWDTIRSIPLTPSEIESYQIADSIIALEEMDSDTIKNGKTKKKKSIFSKVFFGASNLSKDSLTRLSYDGLISTENFDFNAVDGYKYKQEFRYRYNPDSAKYIYVTPVLGYAFNREALFGSLSTRFVNIAGYGNSFGFSLGKESRDFKHPSIGINPALNAISTWFFAENYMKLYEKEFIRLNSSQRLKKNFNLNAALEFEQFYPLQNNATYLLNNNKEFSPNIPKGLEPESPELVQQKSFTYSLGINYRKRLRKPWLQESPFLFINDFYSINLYFKQGLQEVFSSVSNYSQIDFRFQHQTNISPSSGIDWKINAGHFFTNKQMHFSQFKHFQTAEIPILISSFTHTFQMLNDYEFSTNKSYLNIGAEYRSEYVLLRYLSFINRRTWSESIHFNVLSTPDLQNYWEAGYSLNSLFFVGNIGVFTGFKGSKFESVAVKVSISALD